jgi:hypothetical protein
MRRVTFARRFHRSRLRLVAAAFAAAAQLGVSAFAPVLDARAGTGAPSHVETYGVRLHFAHDPNDCAACTAQTLVGVTSAPAVPLVVAGDVTAEFAHAPLAAPLRADWRSDAPRAPPSLPDARSLS